jgi:hypothetical protein
MRKKEVIWVLIAALLLATLITHVSSPWPDGLERVAVDQGFEKKAENPIFPSPIPDYLFPGLTNKEGATSLSGALGTLAMFCVGCGVAILLKRRKD